MGHLRVAAREILDEAHAHAHAAHRRAIAEVALGPVDERGAQRAQVDLELMLGDGQPALAHEQLAECMQLRGAARSAHRTER